MAPPDSSTQERIILLLQTGNHIDIACKAVGVEAEDLEAWLQDPELLDFRREIEKARALAEANLVSKVQQAAANGSWSAAAWLLERGFERWNRPTAEQKNKQAASDPAEAGDPFSQLDNVTELRPRH